MIVAQQSDIQVMVHAPDGLHCLLITPDKNCSFVSQVLDWCKKEWGPGRVVRMKDDDDEQIQYQWIKDR